MPVRRALWREYARGDGRGTCSPRRRKARTHAHGGAVTCAGGAAACKRHPARGPRLFLGFLLCVLPPVCCQTRAEGGRSGRARLTGRPTRARAPARPRPHVACARAVCAQAATRSGPRSWPGTAKTRTASTPRVCRAAWCHRTVRGIASPARRGCTSAGPRVCSASPAASVSPTGCRAGTAFSMAAN